MKPNNTTQRSPITWVPTLYFAMGMPFVVLNMVCTLMFKGLDISDAQIAFWTSIIMFPWTLKPLWSPLLEIYKTKKFFVIVTQIATGCIFGLVALALKMHGGIEVDKIKEPNEEGLTKGLANLDKHIHNLQSYGQTVVVAFNRFAEDTDAEIALVEAHCQSLGVGFAVNSAYAKGSEGAEDLARLVAETIEKHPSDPVQYAYEDTDSVVEKVEKVAKNIYGAAKVTFSAVAKKKLQMIADLGIGHFPICIAKTQYSFSTDAKLYGVVSGFEVNVRDIVLNTGAEMIVIIAGNIMRMPGLPKDPQANHIDIIGGEIEGLS